MREAVTYIDLKSLPPEHPLRNRPLAQIGAEYSWRRPGYREWRRDCGPETFNEIFYSHGAWLEWRVKAEVTDEKDRAS